MSDNDCFPVEYGTLSHMFHLMMYFFQYITGIAFKCNGLLWCIVGVFVCIGIWAQLILYMVSTDPVKRFVDFSLFSGTEDNVKYIVEYRG